ncbi:hypothetical protein C7H09_04975 [Marinobacter fuscus]|uniref:Uncharacterized protein n=1 Tax=Marinobacter fuscus TaxID=2109942 RepID=A0A2T1KQH1_9GAMM|nr:hypothetical protein C7H09_04975 [Marinobacter fuscus]
MIHSFVIVFPKLTPKPVNNLYNLLICAIQVRHIASRVRRYRLIPLTEPYIRATYTAHAINLPRTRGR